MKRLSATTLFILLFMTTICAQKNSVTVEGYVYAEDNSGYIKGATVTLLSSERTLRGEVITDELGKFEFMANPDETYTLRVRKTGFNYNEIEFSTKGKDSDNNAYLDISLKRAPGYIFEATMADWRPEDSNIPVDAIEGATIEVYNKTKQEVVLELKNHPYHTFNFRMEQGNSYVILIRKKEYFNKRIDAHISIDGCILCIEGVGITRSGVVDNLTDNNMTGTLGANIALKKITMDESVKVDNIYYDSGKYNITKNAAYELDKLVSVLNDNPHIAIELSSHTDSRGDARANLALSQKRAEIAAAYIIEQGIDKSRITAKGYGETVLVVCKNGADCDEKQHQKNRRTEFKVTSITADENKEISLASMMEKELFEENLEELMFQEVVEVSNNKSTTYESYGGGNKPKKSGKQSTNRNSLLSSSEEEYVDFGSTKTKKPKAKPSSAGTTIEYNLTNDPFRNPEPEEEVKSTTKTKITNTQKSSKPLHQTKKVSKNYTGYKIEVFVSNEVLAEDHRLFREMGGVEMDVSTTGKYVYLIGNFSSEKSASHFLDNVIKGRFPDAKLQKYDKGNRL